MKRNNYLLLHMIKTIAILSAIVIGCSPALIKLESAYAEQTVTEDGVIVKDGWPVPPETVSESAILIDADTGAMLYEKDPHRVTYPASTTKILTGLLTIESCAMDETVTFSNKAANSVTIEDASLGTRTGEQYSVEQALYGLLLYSANEIAYGLAEHVSGSLEAFTELMNERATELGALNTHFANASGLHSEDHYTTAYDMAMIARGCYNNPTFVSIDSTPTTYTIPPTNKSKDKRIFRHRHLMLKGRTYEYEYCKGGKTGFTDQAGYTLVTFAEKDDMRLICVCFQSNAEDRFKDTRKLFDWGFENFKKLTTSVSTISSLFTSDNYQDSKVFNTLDLNLNLNASTLTLPKDKTIGNVTIDVDKNTAPVIKNNIYEAKLNFLCDEIIVGNALLNISTNQALMAASNLPLNKNLMAAETYKPRSCLVINVWILAGAFLAILLLLYMIAVIKRIKKRRRRRSRRRLKF